MTKDDDVGYGKPPKNSQWKPGQSGNPRGRPKRKTLAESERELREMMMLELQAPIPITENGCVIKLPAIRVITRRIVIEAAKGKRWAIEMYNDLLKEGISGYEEDQVRAYEMLTEVEERLRNLPDGEKDLEAVQLHCMAGELLQRGITGE
jgi:Family of unknown function (DUF5681)